MSHGQHNFCCDCSRTFRDGEVVVTTKEMKCLHYDDGSKELVENREYYEPKFIEVYCDECWDSILIGSKQR